MWARWVAILDGILTPTPSEPAHVPTIKMSYQKIKSFSGQNGEWHQWKGITQCTFEGSGYEKVLTDRAYANRFAQYNRIVCAMLNIATSEGEAHHLVNSMEDTHDGHQE